MALIIVPCFTDDGNCNNSGSSSRGDGEYCCGDNITGSDNHYGTMLVW